MRIRQNLIICLLLAVALGGCRKRHMNVDSKNKTLEPMVCQSSGKVENFKLGFAEKNGISHQVFKDTVVPINANVAPERSYVLRVSFGSLSEAQYRLLMDHYGGQDFVPYDANRCYQLEDFLPPNASFGIAAHIAHMLCG